MFMTPRSREKDCPYEIERGDPDQDAYAFVRATTSRRLGRACFATNTTTLTWFSQVFWSGVHGVAALHLIMGNDTWVEWRPAEEVARTAIELIIRGLLQDRRDGKGGKRWLTRPRFKKSNANQRWKM